MTKLLLIFFTGTVLISGCASTLLSDDRLVSNTASVLGLSPSDITITDRREATPNTYYTVVTRSGAKFACTINGGNIMTMGMTNPPACTKK